MSQRWISLFLIFMHTSLLTSPIAASEETLYTVLSNGASELYDAAYAHYEKSTQQQKYVLGTGILGIGFFALIIKRLFGDADSDQKTQSSPHSGSFLGRGFFGNTPGILGDELILLTKPFSNYACSDAHRFINCIPKNQIESVLERARIIPPHTLIEEAKANQGIALGGFKKLHTLKKTADLINKCKSGCCTTLAATGAYQIISKLKNNFPKLVLKIVSWTGEATVAHVYLFVEHEGEEWIIDPWANSLGYSGIFTRSTFPYQGMLSPIKILAEFTIGEMQ